MTDQPEITQQVENQNLEAAESPSPLENPIVGTSPAAPTPLFANVSSAAGLGPVAISGITDTPVSTPSHIVISGHDINNKVVNTAGWESPEIHAVVAKIINTTERIAAWTEEEIKKLYDELRGV